MFRLSLGLCGLLLAGCASPFSASGAREVSRERLVEIADAGPVDHLRYVGSDLSYHYVNDVRPGKKRTYKIRADQVTLQETFPVGEDSYPLYPWVIEGKPFGTRTQADWPGEAERSPMRGPQQPIVDGPAEP